MFRDWKVKRTLSEFVGKKSSLTEFESKEKKISQALPRPLDRSQLLIDQQEKNIFRIRFESIWMILNLFIQNPLVSKKIKTMNTRSLSTYLFILLASIIFSSCSSKPQQKAETAESTPSVEPKAPQKTILFFGNSLTAAYGIDPEDGFAGLTQFRIDSLGLDYKVINGGLSGETTAGGLSRLDWFLEDEPTIFILELGGNDGLRGILLSETKNNLLAIIDKVRSKYPDTKIILAGMQIPPNMGQEYAKEFSELYPAVAAEKNVTLIPFLLDRVGGIPELNLPDGIHPTEAGHRIVFETIWPYIEAVL